MSDGTSKILQHLSYRTCVYVCVCVCVLVVVKKTIKSIINNCNISMTHQDINYKF